ncbi:MAG TPA: DsbA family protein [Solirubrobacterales bacterium]|nr:DsbA family protein [Solirubrobacterales bacterium]
MGRAVFFYDLGSPYAYLAAERVNGLFGAAGLEPPEWQPILLGGLFKRFGRESWGSGPRGAAGIRECERRAAERGLPPFRWPDPWPGDMLDAMRAATFAKEIGRAVSFSLAAFRQAFAAGRDLSVRDNVLLAGAAAEIHPRALAAAIGRESVKARLRAATERAGDLGVRGVPAVVAGDRVFWGDDQLEDARDADLERAGLERGARTRER